MFCDFLNFLYPNLPNTSPPPPPGEENFSYFYQGGLILAEFSYSRT